MSLYYFDTSALVKYYVSEPGSRWITSLVEEQEPATGSSRHIIFVAAISIVEVSAALSVIHRQRKISRRQRDAAFAHFLASLEDQFVLLSVSLERFYEGADLARRHPLKAYDAIQLAVVLHQSRLLAGDQFDLAFVCGDKALLRAAQAEGLVVENPFDHVSPQDQA